MKIFRFQKKLLIQILLLFLSLPIIAEDNYFKFLQNKIWGLSEYYDILYNKDKYKLIELFPQVEENYVWRNENQEYYYPYTWDSSYFSDTVYRLQFESGKDVSEDFPPDEKILQIGDISSAYFRVLNESVSFINQNSFEINYLSLLFQIQDKTIIPFPATKKGKSYNIKIIFDGDYLDFYIDDIFIHKFCRMNTDSLMQYSTLIEKGECDLSKVTWPRHADGTSYYDDKIIFPEPLISEAALIQLKTAQPDTELSVLQNEDNKNELVIKDVKNIRQGEINQQFRIYIKPKGLLISEINPGAKVKILEIGPEDTIENIKSNWVKVKITNKILNTKNESCKGVIGWIFGGYLEY